MADHPPILTGRPWPGFPCAEANGLPRLRYNPYALSPKQTAFLLYPGEEALFGGSGGSGKLLALDTPILTTEGWSTIGDLRVGDLVFDHDGEPTMVTWKSPVDLRPDSYRVETTDGEVIDCCADHLWTVTTERQRQNWANTDPRRQAQRRARRPSRGRTEYERVGVADGRAHGTADSASRLNSARAAKRREGRERPSRWDYAATMTTAEVVALQKGQRNRVAIPAGGPLRTTGGWLSECPPYTLGVWFGDGGSSTGYVYVCEDDRDALASELEADGWIVETRSTSPAGGRRRQDFHALRLTAPDGRSLRAILKAEGLLGTKSVPGWVHSAPHADRQAFLGGFCDTDGYVDQGGRVEFCLAVEHLVRDVHSLFWSIGEAPQSVRRKVTRNQTPGFEGEAWRFGISRCSGRLFRLPRKRDRLATPRSQAHDATFHRSIKSIRSIDPVPMQCIRVDNDRGLFRVGRSHLVTHNSIGLLAAALQFVDVPGYNAALFRRSLTDFTLPDGLIDVSHDWLDNTDAQWNGNKYRWTFPSGAVLQFAYLKQWGAERRYKSTQFQFVGFDEVTEFPWEEQMLYLFSRMRTGVDSAEMAAEVYGVAPDGLTLYDVPLRMRGATNPGGPGHCVPYGEVLTPDGWVDIASMAVGDPVFQVALDGTLEETEVRQVHRYLSEEIVKVEARGLHMAMTPEHRVAKVGGTRLDRGAHHSLVPWKDLPGQATVLRSVGWIGTAAGPVEVPRHRGKKRQPEVLTEVQYATLLGWFLSEGCLVDRDNAIGIAQSKPETRAKLQAFLDECEFVYSTTPAGFVLYAADWYDHLHSQEFGLSRDKYVPRRILDAPQEVLAAFIEAAMDGDGHRESPTSGTYYTISERLADDVAEALVKLGYQVFTSKRQRDNREGPTYQVNYKVTKSGGTEVLTGQHLYDVQTSTTRRSDVERLKTKVPTYCIGVDSHAFVLRQGGSVWVSGNSWTYARYVDKENPNRQPFLPATLDDNPGINKEEYRKMLAKLPEVERQRMEEGNWDVIEVPGALWRFADYQHVDQKWVPPASDVGMRVLSIDPSITAEGDECGMIMGSITGGVVTVELDLSKQMHPDVWARLAIETMIEYGCDRVVCEDNQGGELVFSALRNAADAMGVPYPRIIKVHSSVSKEARAVPVAQAYRAGKVRHSVLLRSGPLESQQTSWVPGISKESPDRIDADVWLVRHALFGEGDVVEYHNSSARQQLSSRNQSTNAPVVHSTAGSALRKGSSRGPGRL